MTEYEITYLTSPQLTEEARAELDGSVDSLLDKLAGTITHSEPATRRRLFYPIKKEVVGFSRTVNITLDPAHVAEVRQALHKQAGVLRAAIIATPRREDVAAAVFEAIDQADKPMAKAAKPASPATPKKRPAKEVTMAEVEEKIEAALDEEVK